ncbi:uncharacterized protein V1518DRAFT_409131 [Limtongia smithiae]|uniref:uncharacterized protein n=1 Tax=Limtongia smithiae TaxID=1125753 RepID=UPI0034CEADB2
MFLDTEPSPLIAQVLEVIAYCVALLAPQVLVYHAKRVQKLQQSSLSAFPELINVNSGSFIYFFLLPSSLRGLSVDFLVLSASSCCLSMLYCLLYLFPSHLLLQQHARRYSLIPVPLKRRFILLFLPALSAIVADIRLLTLASIRAKLSTICKCTLISIAFLLLTIYVLSSHVFVDPTTGMGFYGLFYIDAIDALRGASLILHAIQLWPQVAVNYDETNTVAWSTTYTHLLAIGAGCEILGCMSKSISARDFVVGFRPPGTILDALNTFVLVTVLYLQIFIFYRADNMRKWRGLLKRAEEQPPDHQDIPLVRV